MGELREEEVVIRERVGRLRDEENRLKKAREEKEKDATDHLNKVHIPYAVLGPSCIHKAKIIKPVITMCRRSALCSTEFGFSFALC